MFSTFQEKPWLGTFCHIHVTLGGHEGCGFDIRDLSDVFGAHCSLGWSNI